MQTVKIGLLGLGTVGSGTVNVLNQNAQEILRRTGRMPHIYHVAARQYDATKMIGFEQIEKKSNDAFAVVNDPEVEIVIELIGGYSPAKELVLTAIANGKHVITANKALIAMHGNEIFAAAQQKNCIVAFEAAVAGGIPIIKTMREGLVANQIQWVAGIINGTGNFILTEMRQKNRDFDSALRSAQALGYAEADPTFDIEGIDAAHKLTIISSLAFGIPLQFDKTYTEGITNINQQDIVYAAELGYAIKHLGIAQKTEQGIEMRVHPTLIPQHCLMANVNGVMNAILIKSNAVGTTFYYGAGAGSEPTASAVIADVVDIIRHSNNAPENRLPHLAFQPNALSNIPILPITEIQTAYYLRIQVPDLPGILANITTIFGDLGINLEAIIQKPNITSNNHVSVIFLTQQVQEKTLNIAIEKIQALQIVEGEISRIRVEKLE